MSTTTLIIPTYIANRYGERPVGLEGLDLETKLEDILLRIEILESDQIRSIKSNSHDILVNRGKHIGQAQKWDHIGQETDETAIVTLKEHSTWLETDFILSIDTTCSKGAGESQAWLEMHPTFEDQAAMMVTLPPWLLHSENDISPDGEILFVADRSGSMEDKMKNLRSAMHFFLKGIPVGRIFNIWCFGSSHQPLWPESQVYGRESLRQALELVDERFHSDMAGTELLPALKAIIAARDPSLSCDVVILTDGEVWRLDETLSLVRKAHESSEGAIRFFSLGLGDHVSHALVEGIAKQGGGSSEIIARADKEGWEESVIAILKASLTRHVHNLKFDFGDLKGITSPENLKSLNPFHAHRIFLLLEEGKVPEVDRVTLTWISDGEWIPIDVSITRTGEPGTLIHTLSARAILNDMEREICNNGSYKPFGWPNTGEGEDLSRLAEDLACKYALPSKWTSLLLLMENGERSGLQATHGAIHEIVTSYSEDMLLRARGLGQSTPLLNSPDGAKLKGRRSMVSRYGSPDIEDVLDEPRFRRRAPPGRLDFCELVRSQRMQRMARRDEAKSTSGSSWTEGAAGRELISLILSHQAFDGSIASRVLMGLPKEVNAIARGLNIWLHERIHRTEVAIDLVANTALTIAFLQRDFQHFSSLWLMMREKGMAYIRRQVRQLNLERELMIYTSESLRQVNRENLLKQKAEVLVIKNDEDQPDSDRVPVHRAPID